MQTQATFDAGALKARFNPEGSQLRKHQLKMLEMVVELDKICRRHQIPYFLYGGTLLGAIRHNGFIPWDDDLDVAVMRKDYLRLMKILPEELPDHIALQTNETDPNYFYFFAKLRDRHSLLEEECPYDQVFKERGVYIDIFPFEKMRFWTHLVAEPLQGHTFKIFRTSSNRERAMRKIRAITWFNRHITFPVLRGISRITCGKTLTYDYGIPFHIVYDEQDIFPLTTHVFEGVELSVPGNSHHMLETQYGDYMQLPNLDHLGGHVSKLELYDE
ncbi:MAG: LicD family protein [Bacteroidales bacterium]|nr:LicD family protein [Bacteroidales bacterium]